MPDENKPKKKKSTDDKEKSEHSDEETREDASPDDAEDACLLPSTSSTTAEAGGSPLKSEALEIYRNRSIFSTPIKYLGKLYHQVSEPGIKPKKLVEEKDRRKSDSAVSKKKKSVETSEGVTQDVKNIQPLDVDPSKDENSPSKEVSKSAVPRRKHFWSTSPSSPRSSSEKKPPKENKKSITPERKEPKQKAQEIPASLPSGGARPKEHKAKKSKASKIEKQEAEEPKPKEEGSVAQEQEDVAQDLGEQIKRMSPFKIKVSTKEEKSPGTTKSSTPKRKLFDSSSSSTRRPSVETESPEGSQQIAKAEKKQKQTQSSTSVPGPSSTGTRPKEPDAKKAKKYEGECQKTEEPKPKEEGSVAQAQEDATQDLGEQMKEMSPFKSERLSTKDRSPGMTKLSTPKRKLFDSGSSSTKYSSLENEPQEGSKQIANAEKKQKQARSSTSVPGPSSTGTRPKEPKAKKAKKSEGECQKTEEPKPTEEGSVAQEKEDATQDLGKQMKEMSPFKSERSSTKDRSPGMTKLSTPKRKLVDSSSSSTKYSSLENEPEEGSKQIDNAEKKQKQAQSSTSVPGPSSTGTRPKEPKVKKAKKSEGDCQKTEEPKPKEEGSVAQQQEDATQDLGEQMKEMTPFKSERSSTKERSPGMTKLSTPKRKLYDSSSSSTKYSSLENEPQEGSKQIAKADRKQKPAQSSSSAPGLKSTGARPKEHKAKKATKVSKGELQKTEEPKTKAEGPVSQKQDGGDQSLVKQMKKISPFKSKSSSKHENSPETKASTPKRKFFDGSSSSTKYSTLETEPQEGSKQISKAAKKQKPAQSSVSVPGASSTGARPKDPKTKKAKKSDVEHQKIEDSKTKEEVSETQKQKVSKPVSKEKKGKKFSFLPVSKKERAPESKPPVSKHKPKKDDNVTVYTMGYRSSESSGNHPTDSSSVEIQSSSVSPEVLSSNQPSSTEPPESPKESTQRTVSREQEREREQSPKKPDPK